MAITPAGMRALDAIWPAGVYTEQKMFGLSESQITRRVKAAGLSDWENFSGHIGRVGMPRRMAQNGARNPTIDPPMWSTLPPPLTLLSCSTPPSTKMHFQLSPTPSMHWDWHPTNLTQTSADHAVCNLKRVKLRHGLLVRRNMSDLPR